MTALQTFVGWDGKNARRGAISRVAEHLQCNYATVQKWLRGVYAPGAETQKRIDAMITENIDLEPKQRDRATS